MSTSPPSLQHKGESKARQTNPNARHREQRRRISPPVEDSATPTVSPRAISRAATFSAI
jgi:hypothetical protein